MKPPPLTREEFKRIMEGPYWAAIAEQASPRSHYDSSLRKVVLAPDASLYARFHEEAHKEQHDKMTFLWRVYFTGFFHYFAKLAIEYDAYRRARRVMERQGLWDAAAAEEARECLQSYLMKREVVKEVSTAVGVGSISPRAWKLTTTKSALLANG